MPKQRDKSDGISARQLGLVTWRQAVITAGLTERQIAARVKTGRWRKIRYRVYAVSGVPASWEQSLLAAVLSARTESVVKQGKKVRLESAEDAVACGRSALWLRGCKRLDKPKAHELLVSRVRVPRIAGANVRRTRILPSSDVEIISGIPTLAIPRLLVELSRELDKVKVTAVLDDLLGPGHPGLREEVHARAVALSKGRRGVRRLIELTAPGAEAAFRSWLERHTAGLMVAARLPRAAWNVELFDDAGESLGIADAVWAAQRVVVELDGLRFHTTVVQRRRDNRKDRRLGTCGWLVLRYTWLDVMERPDDVVKEIAEALRRRRTTLPVDVDASAHA